LDENRDAAGTRRGHTRCEVIASRSIHFGFASNPGKL
jgi:hypothetical protein